MKSDISKKRICEITDKPIKVRLIRDIKAKYSSFRTMRYLKLYYSNHINILVPFDDFIDFNPNVNLKKVYQKCLALNDTKIKYLEESKIAITGGEKYIRIIKEACYKTK